LSPCRPCKLVATAYGVLFVIIGLVGNQRGTEGWVHNQKEEWDLNAIEKRKEQQVRQPGSQHVLLYRTYFCAGLVEPVCGVSFVMLGWADGQTVAEGWCHSPLSTCNWNDTAAWLVHRQVLWLPVCMLAGSWGWQP
jgi:hypothetical protein